MPPLQVGGTSHLAAIRRAAPKGQRRRHRRENDSYQFRLHVDHYTKSAAAAARLDFATVPLGKSTAMSVFQHQNGDYLL